MEWLVEKEQERKDRIGLPAIFVDSLWQDVVVAGKKFQVIFEPDLDSLFIREEKGGVERSLSIAHFSWQKSYDQSYDFKLSFYNQQKLFLDGNVRGYFPFVKAKDVAQTKNRTIPSPITGTVLKIVKTAGDKVTKGETVLIIEAMKMENQIQAPFAGQINEIFVKQGSAISIGGALFSL